MRTSSSDSDAVTGLEIWRQMAVTMQVTTQTRVVTLFEQIMTPTEWNPEKSTNVLQMYHHWLELISKFESFSSEKIASNIKIMFALQNVRGPFANALSFPSASTRSQHGMRFTPCSPTTSTTDPKEIYQFDISGKASKDDSVNQVGTKGKGKSKKSKGQSKGKGSSQNQYQNKGKGKSKGQSKGKQNQKQNVNGPHGQVNLGRGIKVKVGKEKAKVNKYVLIVVAKVTQ